MQSARVECPVVAVVPLPGDPVHIETLARVGASALADAAQTQAPCPLEALESRRIRLDIKEIVSFAKRLNQDFKEVYNALLYPYSNGFVEGNVNRLKMIKRMMYGRGKLDLLRQRVLYQW